MRSPSSLIFLVLLGVWAAYFVQYWVRRRDHIATARSVEQFTQAMRVLERRDPLPRTDLSEQAPRSYAVHPARANRPQVLIKRAVAAEHAGPLTVTARVTDTDGRTVHGADRVADSATSRFADRGTRGTDRVTDGGTRDADGGTRDGATSRPAASGSPAGAGPAPRAVRGGVGRIVPVRPRLRPSRAVRGLIVLASLAELVVIVPLVVLSMLPAWALATAGLTVVAALAYLRSGVRTEQAMMRSHRRRQADLARLRSSAPFASPVVRRAGAARTAPPRTEPARTATVAAPASGADVATAIASGADVVTGRVADAGPATVAEPATVAAQPIVAQAAPFPLEVALEVAAEGEATASVQAPVVTAAVPFDVMVPILDEDDMPLTWDPVPVPRPTYTMKAKAQRREVAPAAVTPDPPRVVREEQDEDTAYDQRRVAGA